MSFLLGTVLAGLAGACTGHGRMWLVPLSSSRISEAAPLLHQVKTHKCYYWLNQDGELTVAMEAVRPSLVGRLGSEEFRASLVLGELPAGRGRDYRVTRRTLRLQAREGWAHARAASLTGIVAVWRKEGEQRWHGRFRILARQQAFLALLGWGRDSDVLLLGEFVAVPGQAQGEAILALTEEGGMERDAPPVTGRAGGTAPDRGGRREDVVGTAGGDGGAERE
ncbi:MAG TPA: hypothetical protein PKK06_00980 [Phycisphaerae bacterium]|nr:hypothetical protein [Phycisphaerae bacterium]HNU43819.1 hypothetical protein [Phycisphaerae bacterium]